MTVHVLGISAFYHDAAACLLRDGTVVAAAQEERFTRRKHDPGFPAESVRYCLRAAEIGPEQVDHVVFYEKPWLTFERLLETYLAYAPRGLPSFLKAMPVWIREKLWLGDRVLRETGFAGELLYSEHHVSHAASAFYPSPFARAAVLTMDGVGEWATASWGTAEESRVTLRQEQRFPHSVGLLYSAFTYYLGFRVNSGEYKVMGLAPYGEPRYAQRILDEIVEVRDDGSIRLDLRYFDYPAGLRMTSRAFDRVFGGPPRRPEAPLTPREMDLAASIQAVTDEIVLRTARHVRRETGERDLCMAGGVALNCVANGKLQREGIFDRVWIQPAAGDAGGALGAALWAWHHHLGHPRAVPADGRDGQQGSCLGPAFAPDQVAAWLTERQIPFRRCPDGAVAREAAALLAAGRVVGWFSGRMEFGPRALGSRSILGDPRDPHMQSVMNLKIKFRESFRPFAPSCLLERAGDYFDLDVPSPYMMLVAPVRPERRMGPPAGSEAAFGIDRLNQLRSDIPAVTHVDYTARLQTVNRHDHPAFRSLIEEFERMTGCGVVVNTSFNVRGEPIVCTPEDAYRCFMRTEMDALVMEDCLLLKDEQPRRPEWTTPAAFEPD